VKEHFAYGERISTRTRLLRTPDFEYSVTVDLDPEIARIIIRQDIVGSGSWFARSSGFTAFGKRFDASVFEFAEPVDVIALWTV